MVNVAVVDVTLLAVSVMGSGSMAAETCQSHANPSAFFPFARTWYVSALL